MTREQGHTPGPWRIRNADNFPPGTVWEGGDNPCTIAAGPYKLATVHFAASNTDANARLIAAAPELLAACQAVLELLERMTTDAFSKGADKAVRVSLRAAIAKALGDQAPPTGKD